MPYRRGIRIAWLAAVTALCVGCAEKPASPPLIVYAGSEDPVLDDLFREYAEQADVPIDAVWGDSTANTDAFIEASSPQPDVLITNNVADIWRAAEEGALRPIEPQLLAEVSKLLRDADGYWAAVELRPHRIVAQSADLLPAVTSFVQLAGTELKGRLCLVSSSQPASRALLAMLINKHGEKATERAVRLWVRNLARPPFGTQDALLEAMRAGDCDYAVVAGGSESDAWHEVVPEPDFRSVDAVGIARHAAQPEVAQQFVGWLLQRRRIESGEAAGQVSVSVAGWLDEDAVRLAERAGYR